MNNIKDDLKKRILILDGGMGTMIQRFHLDENDYRGQRFASHHRPIKGNNDVLCMTRPDVIASIHRQYLEAGADIIETCTFGANAVSQAEYGLDNAIADMNLAAAKTARHTVDEYMSETGRICYVAGSVGPTGVSLSISANVDNPAQRSLDFDTLCNAFQAQIDALIEGGVDVILGETNFDALNIKALIYALDIVKSKRHIDIPLMISASVADCKGRLLNGQSLPALMDVIDDYPILSFGLNCGFGAEDMGKFLPMVSSRMHCAVSCYPNAGLPDANGGYDSDAGHMADIMSCYAHAGWLNIAGGCCGTTPLHIAAVASRLKDTKPRNFGEFHQDRACFSGLESIENHHQRYIVAERANVTGSRKFKKLIESCQWDEALDVTRNQMDNGQAQLIDICMDDALLDAPSVMREFLRRIQAEPDISQYPIVIDSSDYRVALAGLKECVGRSLVNSISLKNGEEEFLAHAREIRLLGGNVIVMAFDEKGQASNTKRRVEILTRAVNLLIEKLHFRPENIALDANILAIGTGLPEHADQALSFIETCRIMRKQYPGIETIGGLSNLSFSFRGRDDVRNAIHQAFLDLAGEDLTMVIANPGSLQSQSSPELMALAKNLVNNAHPSALEDLLSWMTAHEPKKANQPAYQLSETSSSPAERLKQSFISGVSTHLQEDIELMAQTMKPIEIIEGPLMDAMNEVGDRFGRGEMYLPQIVKAARLMKQAIGYLNIEENSEEQSGSHRKKLLLATVFGDVHDIGKNIVNIVLSCNGYEVMDLGVMVETEKIVEQARIHHVDAIGLSGLISPSLNVMVEVAQKLNEAGIHVPLLVGGAATSEKFVALRMESVYAPGIVCHTSDASRVPAALTDLLRDETRNDTIQMLRQRYASLRNSYHQNNQSLRTLDEARRLAPTHEFPKQLFDGLRSLAAKGLQHREYRPDELENLISYDYICRTIRGKSISSTDCDNHIREDIHRLIDCASKFNILTTRAVMRFVPARPKLENIEIQDSDGQIIGEITGHRVLNTAHEPLALADFVDPQNGTIGLFAMTTPLSDEDIDLLTSHIKLDKDYIHVLAQTVSTALVDAANDLLHHQIVEPIGRYVAPAPGYPICPDHRNKRIILSLTQAQDIGLTLTSSDMMEPLASICGFTIVHPDICYFAVDDEKS